MIGQESTLLSEDDREKEEERELELPGSGFPISPRPQTFCIGSGG